MTMYEAGSITKHGVEIPVRVDDQGRWYATYEGNSVNASSKSALAAQVGKLAKKATVKVDIRFTTLNRRIGGIHGSIARGTATGIHGSTRNVLVRWDAGASEQLTNWLTTLPDLTPDEATTWVALDAASQEAQLALDNFVRPRTIDLRRVVEAAVNKAAEAADKEASE
jgi:hypothetical protein